MKEEKETEGKLKNVMNEGYDKGRRRKGVN